MCQRCVPNSITEVSVEANNSSGPASWRGPDRGKDKTYTVTLAEGIRQQVYCRVVWVEGGDLKCFDASGECVFYAPDRKSVV